MPQKMQKVRLLSAVKWRVVKKLGIVWKKRMLMNCALMVLFLAGLKVASLWTLAVL